MKSLLLTLATLALILLLATTAISRPEPAPAAPLVAGGLPDALGPVWDGAGCGACRGTGYRGRTGIYELVTLDDTMRSMIHDGAGEIELEREARKNSPGIRQDGWRKVLEGETTVEEVLRVTQGD